MLPTVKYTSWTRRRTDFTLLLLSGSGRIKEKLTKNQRKTTRNKATQTTRRIEKKGTAPSKNILGGRRTRGGTPTTSLPSRCLPCQRRGDQALDRTSCLVDSNRSMPV